MIREFLNKSVLPDAGYKNYLIIFLLGFLSLFSLAPFFIWPFYAIAIIYLFKSLNDLTLKQYFWRGFIFGFSFIAFSMFWIGAAFLVDAEKFLWLLPFAVTLLPACMGIYFGLFGLAYGLINRKFKLNHIQKILIFTLLYSLMEYARGHLFTGLPWNLSAYIVKAGGFVSQSAWLLGPYGLGTILIFIFLCFSNGINKQYLRLNLIGLSLVIVIFWFGFLKLQTKTNPNENIKIAVGEAGFSQKELWDEKNYENVITNYLNLLDTPEAKNSNIIVWPEGTFPALVFEDFELLSQINTRLMPNQILIFGTVRREIKNDKLEYFNSIAAIQKSTNNELPNLLGVYDKRHLVPFGEYLPFRKFFNQIGIESLVATGDDFSRPLNPQEFNIPNPVLKNPQKANILVGKTIRFDARVCYEIIFPSFQNKISNNANAILNISVDAWYGKLLGPDQHYNQARFRSIETGLPLLRTAAGGWSSIADSHGRPIIETNEKSKIITANLPPTIDGSFYAMYGDLILTIIWAIFFLSVIIVGKKNKM